MHKPEIVHRVGAAVSLLANVIDVGLAVVTLDESAAELTYAAIAGDHGQPGAAPRRGAVAALGRSRPGSLLPPAWPKRRYSPWHFATTRP